VPFHGGFGLLNIHGIAKPTYRAFELLHHLGTELLPVEGSNATVDAWIVRRGNSATILLTNFALPRHPIAAQVVRVSLRNVSAPIKATIQRIDQHHANPKRRWQELGEPEYPNPKVLAQLHAASTLRHEWHPVRHSGDGVEVDIDMPPLGVAAVTLEFSAARD
jgi:xylan 1,4-beta-xylosidase